MSTLSNKPSDYYFYVTKVGRLCRAILSEKKYWDAQGYKNGTISWSGDSLNFALMKKLQSVIGLPVGEMIEGILEIWDEQEDVTIEKVKVGLEQAGMVWNPAMELAAKRFSQYMLHSDE